MRKSVLVELTTPIAGQMTTVVIAPGLNGREAVADLLEGFCPVCTTPLAEGLCILCSSTDGKPVLYRAVASEQIGKEVNGCEE